MREYLKKYLEINGVTQAHIAKKLGVVRSMISMYLKGERNLSEEKEKKLQEFLLKI